VSRMYKREKWSRSIIIGTYIWRSSREHRSLHEPELTVAGLCWRDTESFLLLCQLCGEENSLIGLGCLCYHNAVRIIFVDACSPNLLVLRFPGCGDGCSCGLGEMTSDVHSKGPDDTGRMRWLLCSWFGKQKAR
jgi:hypothetical protein